MLVKSWIILLGILSSLPLLAQPPKVSWIQPDFQGQQIAYPPRALFWFTVEPNPVIYWKQVTLPSLVRRATFQIWSDRQPYLWVDQEEVPLPESRTQTTPSEGPRTYFADLSHLLTPGKHILWVSAPEEGFALYGDIQFEKGSHLVLSTDRSWMVGKFPPTTILEQEVFKPSQRRKHRWFPVKVDPQQVFQPDFRKIIQAFIQAEQQWQKDRLSEITWRCELLGRKGLVVWEGETFGWGGPTRIPKTLRDRALLIVRQAIVLQESTPSRSNSIPILLKQRSQVQILWREMERLLLSVLVRERARMLRAVLEEVGDRRPSLRDRLFRYEENPPQKLVNLKKVYGELLALRRNLEKILDHPLNELNQSRFNKLGWIPVNSLVDSEIGDWGLRVNPVEVPWFLPLPERWRFQTDPHNQGLAEKRETVGYNIDNQWPEIRVGRSWESEKVISPNPQADRQKPYPVASPEPPQGYDGYAWYRLRFVLPEEWRGNDLELIVDWANDWDWAYFNGELVGKTGPEVLQWWRKPRRYRVPARVVRFGMENVIVWRVYDAGGEGGLGRVRIECPALRGALPRGERTEVLSTPLFPGVLLIPQSHVLRIWGWSERKHPGPSHLLAMVNNQLRVIPIHPGVLWKPALGQLTANWLLLWIKPLGDSPDLPLLLVLERPPVEIQQVRTAGSSSLLLRFKAPGVRVVCLRPFREGQKLNLSLSNASFRRSLVKSCRFWSQASLNFPVEYAEVTRFRKLPSSAKSRGVPQVSLVPLRRGMKPYRVLNPYQPFRQGVIEHRIRYFYLLIKDAWGTPPLRLAPLPPPLSRALDKGWSRKASAQQEVNWTPSLQIASSKVVTLLPTLGNWASYRAILGTDRLTFRYAMDPFPRLAGFTSWMFAPSDTGVPGNERECELIAGTGSNSFRPQHNYNNERVTILTDFTNRYGLTYINNIDETLGGPADRVVRDYERFIEEVIQHYQAIAQRIKDRPFWAVAYDLINEPFHHPHEKYNVAMKQLTLAIRELDPVHLLYIEPPESWGAVEKMEVVEPTGDPLTAYSFHDYNFRLRGQDRWPTLERDITSMYRQFLPALRFLIDHKAVIHCGEFGGYEDADQNPSVLTMLSDQFRVFDQWAMHFHYYPNRGTVQQRQDGSLRESLVHSAYRRYFARGYFNRYWPEWARSLCLRPFVEG